ncbi:hypothetical protein BC829DRAFT_492315, partial [Chytridium lagenaria]
MFSSKKKRHIVQPTPNKRRQIDPSALFDDFFDPLSSASSSSPSPASSSQPKVPQSIPTFPHLDVIRDSTSPDAFLNESPHRSTQTPGRQVRDGLRRLLESKFRPAPSNPPQTYRNGPIHLGMLFPTDNPNTSRILESVGDFSAGGAATLLLGNKRSGKSSLLFQYAVAMASNPHQHVLLIAPSPEKLASLRPCLSRPPTGRRRWVPGVRPEGYTGESRRSSNVLNDALPNVMDPDPEILSRIHIRYPRTAEEMRMMLARLPSVESGIGGTPEPPCCIVVDDFSAFFDRMEEKTVSNVEWTLAVLRDTVSHLQKSAEEGHPSQQCRYFLVDTFEAAQSSLPYTLEKDRRRSPLLDVYSRHVRWVFSVFGNHPAFTMQISASDNFNSIDPEERGFAVTPKSLSCLDLPYPDDASLDLMQVKADITISLETLSIDFEIVDRAAIELNKVELL